jgi:DNA-3-methyladenine glycosylase II
MPPRHAVALTHLRAADPRLGAWIDAAGPCGLRANRGGTHFDAVVRSIVYQQLSGKAAGTIHGRLLGLYGGRNPTPRELARTQPAKLRAVGLSGRKTEYLQDLAQRAAARTLPIEGLHELDDAGVIEVLTAVRGIGEWTAQMFLMFRLGRPDVLPVLDLGVQKGVQLLYGLRKLPSPDRVARIGRGWAPYRTIASWYLWRRADTTLM